MGKRIGYYSNENANDLCVKCKSQIFLLSLSDFWVIDQEPIKSGQSIEEIEDCQLHEKAVAIYENGVELGTEITCHYCPDCKEITSINVNF